MECSVFHPLAELKPDPYVHFEHWGEMVRGLPRDVLEGGNEAKAPLCYVRARCLRLFCVSGEQGILSFPSTIQDLKWLIINTVLLEARHLYDAFVGFTEGAIMYSRKMERFFNEIVDDFLQNIIDLWFGIFSQRNSTLFLREWRPEFKNGLLRCLRQGFSEEHLCEKSIFLRALQGEFRNFMRF